MPRHPCAYASAGSCSRVPIVSEPVLCSGLGLDSLVIVAVKNSEVRYAIVQQNRGFDSDGRRRPGFLYFKGIGRNCLQRGRRLLAYP